MKNILLITRREYLTQVRKKSFILLTILAPLLIIGFGAFIALLLKANSTQHTIAYVDKSGLFDGKLKDDNTIKYVKIPLSKEQETVSKLKDLEEFDGLLIINNIQNNDFKSLQETSKLLVNTKIGFEAKQNVVGDLTEIVRKAKISALGLDEKEITKLDDRFDLKSTNITDASDMDTDLAFGVKYGLGIVLMYAVFMFIIIYGVRVMRSVLEEKNNRVVEIIISSVKPFELMLGKILGVTFVALTQFAVWITMTVVGALFLNTGLSAIRSIPQSSEITDKMDFASMATEISQLLLELNVPLIIFVFIFFFLFGYIFYSSMYAAIGSAVDNETETQQFTLFAMIPLLIGVYGSFTIINNPDGPLGFWLSIIPFTSPVAMVARIPFGVPIWQIALSMVLLVVFSLLMVFVAGKIYRVGILMYGNKASLKEIWRWLRS